MLCRLKMLVRFGLAALLTISNAGDLVTTVNVIGDDPNPVGSLAQLAAAEASSPNPTSPSSAPGSAGWPRQRTPVRPAAPDPR